MVMLSCVTLLFPPLVLQRGSKEEQQLWESERIYGENFHFAMRLVLSPHLSRALDQVSTRDFTTFVCNSNETLKKTCYSPSVNLQNEINMLLEGFVNVVCAALDSIAEVIFDFKAKVGHPPVLFSEVAVVNGSTFFLPGTIDVFVSTVVSEQKSPGASSVVVGDILDFKTFRDASVVRHLPF